MFDQPSPLRTIALTILYTTLAAISAVLAGVLLLIAMGDPL